MAAEEPSFFFVIVIYCTYTHIYAGGIRPIPCKLRKIFQFKNTKFGPPVGGFFSGYSGFPPFRLALKNSVHVWSQTKILIAKLLTFDDDFLTLCI